MAKETIQQPSHLGRIGGAGSPPTRHDLIDIQCAEARWRPLHHGRINLGDLDVESGNPTTNGRFVVELLDLGKLLAHLAEQFERWRQDRDLLAPDKLLHPPVRIVFLTEIREGFTGPRQVVEGSLFPGDTDLRFDPCLPTRPRRFALSHGPPSSLPVKMTTPHSSRLFSWGCMCQPDRQGAI